MPRSALLLFACLIVRGVDARAESSPDSSAAGPPQSLTKVLAARAWALTDAVLEHHVEPPVRQQMLLDASRALYRAAGAEPPSALAQRISAITRPEQFDALVAEIWSQRAADDDPDRQATRLGNALTSSLLASVPGHPRLVSAKEYKVEQQLAANLYVGLQIALGHDKETGQPQIAEVFAGGPAERAGVRSKDLIEKIEGEETKGMDLSKVVGRLRGTEGTSVVIRVRQPGNKDARTLTVTRGLLPRQTIEGIRERAEGSSDVVTDGTATIGYLKFKEISGSTPQELKGKARHLEEEGAKALVIDLRGMSESDFHPTVLLADLLLDGGTIGRVRTAKRVETYEAEPDALFRDWPLAVLVDGNTTGAAEWLAAALQDNRRAFIVGQPTGRSNLRRSPFDSSDERGVQTAVPIGDGTWLVVLTTGRLERGDGRPVTPRAPAADPDTPRRRAAPGMPTTQDDTDGLRPDIVAGMPTVPRVFVRGPQPTRKAEANVASDAILTAALRHLQGILKSRPAPTAPQRRPAR